MNDLLRNAAVIPSDWTSDEALLVASFLQEIIDAIWIVHGDGMDRLLSIRHGNQHALNINDVNGPEHAA